MINYYCARISQDIVHTGWSIQLGRLTSCIAIYYIGYIDRDKNIKI